ncbi:LacI family DNA-binding transcriptional regulator [Sphingomonas rubra]|uniref:LacI family DNA-binding transcriptional regulator n=1 Tax=Sphingomonas rubra TaxID=634430 RepID=UPI001FDF6C30|nr:LacI family DNA-binding transcriptional regulator [Sphingomonas rubra]
MTISDVASAAGVSIRTVSRVLNKSDKVAADSRERIEATIRDLGFSPSSRARALASGRSSLIGVVQDDPNAQVIGVLQRGIVDICAASGYELVVHPARFAAPDLVDNIRDFALRSRIDGLIVLPPVSEVAALPRALARLKVPAIGIAAVGVPGYSGALISEERSAAALLGEHLIALGHRRVAIITGPRCFHSATERERGFRSALDRHGVTLPDHYVMEGDYGFATGHAHASHLLGLEVPPTAIFGCNDITAAAVIKAAHDRGLRVPDDLSVVGFDDSELASMISPALTTIRRPLLDMAHEATRRLIAMIDDRERPDFSPHHVPLGLVERSSTARCR